MALCGVRIFSWYAFCFNELCSCLGYLFLIQYVTMKKNNLNNNVRKGGATPGSGLVGDSSGQAAVEYILVISILTMVITWALIYALNDSLQAFFDEIAAYVSLPFP